MNFYSQYEQWIGDQYPEIQPFLPKSRWKHSVFPEIVTLPSSLLPQITRVVSAIYSLKSDRDYLGFLKSRLAPSVRLPHFQDSVLMAYDFHIDPLKTPRLIEVNTNGAGFLITNAVYEAQGLSGKKSLEDLVQSFQAEWDAFQTGRGGSPDSPPRKAALMDENPFHQKMLLEFFMYKELFCSLGWKMDIYDSADLAEDSDGFLTEDSGQRVDFIYNRSTDFYFKDSPHLQRAYLGNRACFSPHPSEYFLFSDKNRLCDWSFFPSKWPALKSIQGNLIRSQVLTKENAAWAWENRKNLFFKMSRGHGGQSAYRGKSLTRGKFKQLLENSVLFQDYIPPSVFPDSLGQEWKVDLRAYAYRGRIQQIAARCYRGQVTNFREEGGGFAAVKFV